MSSETAVVCMFCGDGIVESSSDRLIIRIEHPDHGASGAYWCHDECLIDATHSSVPLYLLSLERDEAVYGRRS